MIIFTVTNAHSQSDTIGCSQTKKGRMFIAGQFNIYGDNASNLNDIYLSNRKSFEFQISPNFGYFIRDNIAVGANLKFGLVDSTRVDEIPIDPAMPTILTGKSNSLSYGTGCFVRYYKKITDNFLFFLNARASYTYKTTKLGHYSNDPGYIYSAADPAIQEVQAKNISVGISPGLVYFMTPKLGIETTFSSIYYSNSSSKNISVNYDNYNNVNTFGFNFNITTFYLGLTYNF
jgi:hypothetical protein